LTDLKRRKSITEVDADTDTALQESASKNPKLLKMLLSSEERESMDGGHAKPEPEVDAALRNATKNTSAPAEKTPTLIERFAQHQQEREAIVPEHAEPEKLPGRNGSTSRSCTHEPAVAAGNQETKKDEKIPRWRKQLLLKRQQKQEQQQALGTSQQSTKPAHPSPSTEKAHQELQEASTAAVSSTVSQYGRKSVRARATSVEKREWQKEHGEAVARPSMHKIDSLVDVKVEVVNDDGLHFDSSADEEEAAADSEAALDQIASLANRNRTARAARAADAAGFAPRPVKRRWSVSLEMANRASIPIAMSTAVSSTDPGNEFASVARRRGHSVYDEVGSPAGQRQRSAPAHVNAGKHVSAGQAVIRPRRRWSLGAGISAGIVLKNDIRQGGAA
jgi:hypothetical protein